MAYKIFLDINILVDFFVSTRTGNADAIAIVDMLEAGDLNVAISESVVNTTAYLVRKSMHAEEFRILMDEFVGMTTVLPCSNRTIHTAYSKPGTDLEDAVLYQLALENRLDYFITSNTSDFKILEHTLLPVITANQLLHIVNS